MNNESGIRLSLLITDNYINNRLSNEIALHKKSKRPFGSKERKKYEYRGYVKLDGAIKTSHDPLNKIKNYVDEPDKLSEYTYNHIIKLCNYKWRVAGGTISRAPSRIRVVKNYD